jgi:hypothetical protein
LAGVTADVGIVEFLDIWRETDILSGPVSIDGTGEYACYIGVPLIY